jgi:hypothetical protein
MSPLQTRIVIVGFVGLVVVAGGQPCRPAARAGSWRDRLIRGIQ